jgi:hypothetical protein
VIGPGWLPRPTRFRLRTSSYTLYRRRRSKNRATTPISAHHQIVLFDQGPSELPVATAKPRRLGDGAIAIVSDLRRWLAARWSWLVPRTVPVLVAAAGLVAVLASAEYLSHAHGVVQRVDARQIEIERLRMEANRLVPAREPQIESTDNFETAPPPSVIFVR